MEGLKKLTIRIMFIAVFAGAIFWYTHQFAEYMVVSKYTKRIEQDLIKLSVMVENENVLSNDRLGGDSAYSDYISKVLRMSEDYVLQYDVEQGGPLGIQQKNSLRTPAYQGANQPNNPIQIYYLDTHSNKKFIDSYTNCPNRGEVVYITLTGSIYVPVLTTLRRTSDSYSSSHQRRLEKITKTTSVICSNFYKGK